MIQDNEWQQDSNVEQARLSASFIWERQKDFYREMGVDAWLSGTIPSRITTNSHIAREFARLIASYIVDNDSTEFTIVELGSGHGRFGFLCVQHLKQIQESGLLPNVKWQYVLTDVAERNLEFWEQHDGIRGLIDEGFVDVALYEANQEELYLRHSGRTISAESRTQNLVVIGNYLFDSLPIDLFQVENQELYECLPEITKNPAWTPMDADSNVSRRKRADEFVWHWRQEVADEQVYSDPTMQHLIDHFRNELDDTFFSIPVAGCTAITMLDSWSDGGSLVIMADKGHLRNIDLKGRSLPYPTPHGGCYSFSVNFLAFEEWFKFLGGQAYLPEFRDSALQVAAFTTRSGNPTWPQLDRQFNWSTSSFSPGDYYQVVGSGDSSDEGNALRQCLSTIRLSAYEPQVFFSLRRSIRDAAGAARKRDQQAIREVLREVDRCFFHWGETDIPFAIGHIFQNMDDFSEAAHHYRNSLRLYGDHSATLGRLGTCLAELGETDEALELAKRALSLDPNSRTANALFEWLEEESSELAMHEE